MTTHYILADDFDRWAPGEPIEDVASDVDYLENELYASKLVPSIPMKNHYTFAEWLSVQISAGNIIRIETDAEGRILS